MNIIKGLFSKKAKLKHVTLDGVRLHLRTDERKLWIDGYYMLLLNQTSTDLLENFIDCCYEFPKDNVVPMTIKKFKQRYKVDSHQVETDLNQIIGVINSMVNGHVPTNLVGMELSTKLAAAPNRVDISLSYKCNNHCPHCYLAKNADDKGNLTTKQWEQVIDKLWDIGVPQIVFTGGECTLRQDLVHLVHHSKRFVTGIISNGTNITPALAHALKDAELDWIQITLETWNRKTHDRMQGRKGAFDETVKGIKACVKAGLQVSINATITQMNKKDLEMLIDFADCLGVKIVSTNSIIRSGRGKISAKDNSVKETELRKIVTEAKEYSKKKNISFNWFLPTCYKKFDPISAGLGQHKCSACSVNIMIQPDGSVLPCQSWDTKDTIGNILSTKWESIWFHPTAERCRKFDFATPKCKQCDKFEQCGGGCPLTNTSLVKSCKSNCR